MTCAYEGPRGRVGVVGGSGLYAFVEAEQVAGLQSLRGYLSDPIRIGQVAEPTVAFLLRRDALKLPFHVP